MIVIQSVRFIFTQFKSNTFSTPVKNLARNERKGAQLQTLQKTIFYISATESVMKLAKTVKLK